LYKLRKADTVQFKLLELYRFEVQGSSYKGIKPMNGAYEIWTGGGKGLFTLRRFDGYYHTGDPRFAHIKNLSRDPHEALRKAQDYIRAEGHDLDDLDGFDPDRVVGLNTWGECDPMRQHSLNLIAKGTMPFGKYFGQAISDIPVEYFANWYLDGDIDSKRNDTAKEQIRLQVVDRRDEFMAVVEANKAAQVKREEALEAKRSKSSHVGEIGARIDITATITVVKAIDGFYGISYFTILEDSKGDVFKYVGSAELGAKGDLITMKATVKDHTDYDGVNQTVINRPKLSK